MLKKKLKKPPQREKSLSGLYWFIKIILLLEGQISEKQSKRLYRMRNYLPLKKAMKKSEAGAWKIVHFMRSEEHTSELQSRFDLVCRLLLEKKKQTPITRPTNRHT